MLCLHNVRERADPSTGFHVSAFSLPLDRMTLRYLFRSCFALALLLTASGAGAQSLVINETDADTPGSDTAEFVELYNASGADISLDDYAVVFYNGSNDQSYAAFDLSGTLAPGAFYVLGNPDVPNVDQTFDPGGSGFLQNGADAVALYTGSAADFPDGTDVTMTNLVDAVVYDTNDSDDEGLLTGLGQTIQYDERANDDGNNESIQRSPDGAGSFVTALATPGAANFVRMDDEVFTTLALSDFQVPTDPDSDARGGITATLNGTMLTVTGAFAYLESDYNANIGAHLHGGAAGENGPVRYGLTPTLDADNRGGFFAAGDNMLTVRETFADSLRAGLVYFNLHTVDNPMGEIRGQLGMDADALATDISGDQENPAVETDASGFATVTVDGNMVTVAGSFEGLTGDYLFSHIHAGAADENGPVVLTLDATVPMAMPRSGEWMAADNMFEVRSTFADSLRAGLAYINVHSSAFPNGEIRGQVGFAEDEEMEPMTLADIRAGGVDQEVLFVGVVTRSQGRITYVQDETAAIAIFQASGAFFDAVASGAIASGDSLAVLGTTAQFRGLFQIGTVEEFEVLSRGNDLPMIQRVTLADLAANGEQYESEYIEVRNLTIDGQGAFAAGTTYAVTDGSGANGAVTLRTPSASDTRIAGIDIPQQTAIFRGVLGQFDNATPAVTGYQLSPIAENDVVPQGDASGLVINEILYDPADGLAGDANGDGTRDGSQDEFVEIVNSGTGSVDLGGFAIEDETSRDADDATFARHIFPIGTVLEAGQAVVVFGGGTPTGEFGSSFVQVASSGSLGLNNGGDTVVLASAPVTSNATGFVLATVEYDGTVLDQSIARVPDLTGDFAAHTSNPQNPVRFSPGVSNLTGGGGGFPSNGEEIIDGALALMVANPLGSDTQVRFETPAAGEVSLVLYDALGRQVAVLASGEMAAGAHTSTLRASALAPGVYVLRLATQSEQLTRTLTVVR